MEVNYLNGILTVQGENHQDFQRVLTKPGKNLLLVHLNGRLSALTTFHEHAKSLLKRLAESVESETTGLAIGSRIPHYLKKLDEKNSDEKRLKESLASEELDELQWIGLETLYSLRDVHDAHKETIIGAQVQIGAGLACLAGAFFFPPALPILAPIAGALISEGICDIVIELLSRGYTGFDVKSYVKGKCISFGIALATMGISALATSVKLLDKAAKACRSLAKLLRKCPYLKGVCQKLAGQVDRLANYFDKLKLVAQFGKMKDVEKLDFLKKLKATGEIQKLKQLDGLSKLSQLEHLKSVGKLDVVSKTQLLKSMAISVGSETVQSVTMSLITEHLVTAGLNMILEGLRPSIEVKVREGLKEAKLRETLKMVESRNEVESLVVGVLEGGYGEMAGEVLQEIALGVARYSGNWKLKLTSLGLDTALSLTKIFSYTASFCERFKVAVASNIHSSEDEYEADLKEKEDLVATLVTDKVYRLIMELAGKHAATLVVGPLMSKVMASIGKEGKNAEVDEANEKTLAQIEEAYETLKLSPGAGLEELEKAYRNASLEAHPDKPGGDHGKFLKVGEAYQFVLKLHDDLKSSSSYRPNNRRLLLGGPAGWTRPSPENLSIPKDGPADGGNIATISSAKEQHIIVQHFDETGLVVTKVKEYGSKYKGNGNSSAVLGLLPPTAKNGAVGHYFPIAEEDTPASIPKKIASLKPSPSNNCLYEALAPQIEGGALTPHELRQIGEEVTWPNVKYAVGGLAVELLNNPLMKKLYVKARAALLVGGNLEAADYVLADFLGAVDKLSLEAVEERPSVSLLNACKGDPDAVKAIKDNSKAFLESCKGKDENGKRPVKSKIPESVEVKVYKINGMDSLTHFILNYDHDEKPFVLEYPNGTKSVIAGNLYSMVAYKGDQGPVHVGGNQYNEKFGETVFNSLSALIDPEGQMSLEKYPEISGRLICESIRHPATFLSLCWAMNVDVNTSIAGENGLPVTNNTGVIWLREIVKNWESFIQTDSKNPLWLLGQHVEKSGGGGTGIGQIRRELVEQYPEFKAFKEYDSLLNSKHQLGMKLKAKFDTLFYQRLYHGMKQTLEEANN